MKKEDIHLIEAFLLGQLSEEEQLTVKRRALEEADFAAEISLQTEILKGIQWHEDNLIRQQIAGIDERLAKEGFFSKKQAAMPPSTVNPSLSAWKWVIAIGAVLAAGSIIGFYFAGKSGPMPAPALPAPGTTPTQPIAQNSPTSVPEIPENPSEAASPKPIKPAKTLRQTPLWTTPDYAGFRGENGSSALGDQALAAFREKKYDALQRIVAGVPVSDPNYWYYQEMSGHAAYLSGRFEEATRCFEAIARSGQLPFSERAEWYLLLCYYTDYGQHKTSFNQLKQKIMSDPDHPFYEQTKALK